MGNWRQKTNDFRQSWYFNICLYLVTQTIISQFVDRTQRAGAFPNLSKESIKTVFDVN